MMSKSISYFVTLPYWNPAGLAGSERRRLSFTHNNYIADIDMNYLAYAGPARKSGVWGLSLLRIGIDMNIPSDNRPYYNGGIELWPMKKLAVRFGYDRRTRDLDKWFTGGFGIRFKAMDFNYAYTPNGDLKHAHRFNFGIEF